MKKIHFLLLSFCLLFSCEKEIDLDFPEHENQYVVEGYIEKNSPPLILLSKSDSYYSTISVDAVLESLVSGAEIQISDGINTYDLIEFSTENLGKQIQQLEDSLGFEIDFSLIDQFLGVPQGTTDFAINGGPNNPLNPIPPFSIYTSFRFLGKENTTYYLTVKTPENTMLTAETFLPETSPLDSLWLEPHPTDDTLVTLTVRYTDDPSRANYIRYFTQRNQEFFSPPPFASVLDDRSIFNLAGESFNFPLERGQSVNSPDWNFETYPYFNIKDTIILRWASMDEAHYRFWNTLEFDRGQTGNPFGRPTKVRSNINGGLGIWGAYSSSFYQILPE